jgi:hypothetical protein
VWRVVAVVWECGRLCGMVVVVVAVCAEEEVVEEE